MDETQTADAPSPRRSAPKVPGLVVLFSEAGPIEPATFGVLGRTVLGRDADAGVVLPDAKISRRHAEVEWVDGALAVRDLGSHNGTLLDGAPVGDAWARARAGAVVRIGNTLLGVTDDVGPYRAFGAPTSSALLGGPILDEVRRTLREAALATTPVLIDGESGTGKELAAAEIHRSSGRQGALVAVNCAALPRELVEAELFGHTKGAFSGSDRARAGLFRSADRGTLFLDEVGEMPLETQAKLLRALETRAVRPVGSDDDLTVDVRVLAATNRDLAASVHAGRFRADLYHRLVALHVHMPPLRARPWDVPLLAAAFAHARGVGLSADAAAELLGRPWPGNVRELKHCVDAAAARAAATESPVVTLAHLGSATKADPAGAHAAGAASDDVARARLETALSLRKGNVSHVARDLGVSRQALYRQLEALGLDPTRFRGA